MPAFNKILFIFVLCLSSACGFKISHGAMAVSRQSQVRSLQKPIQAASQTVVTGKLNLLHDNILVKLEKPSDKSSGGILFSDSAKDKVREGSAVAVGPGQLHQDTGNIWDVSVKVGENVVFGEYAGVELNFNGSPHQIISDNDVLYKYATGAPNDVDGFVCVHDFVLVRLDAAEEKSASGVIISAPSQNKKSASGVVLKVGPGRQVINKSSSNAGSGGAPIERLPMPVSVNEQVHFREYAGTELKIKGVKYVVLRAGDILAKA